MQIFLNYVAEVIEKNNYKANCKVVLPSRRAATYLKNICWRIKDNIYSIEELIQFCYKSKGEIVDTTETLLNFYDAYKSEYKFDEIGYDEFASWAYTAIEDFNVIDSALANTEDLFAYLNDSKAIDLWNPEQPELTEIQKKYLQFFKAQYKNYQLLNAHLESQQKAYIGMAYRWIEKNILDVIDAEMLYIVGFNAFNNAERSIFRKLQLAKKAHFIWDTDTFFLDNVNHEAGYFMRNNLSNFYHENTNNFEKINTLLNTSDKHINIIGTAKLVPQAKLLNNILSELKVSNWSNTAIVLANESMLPVVLNSLPQFIDNINVSMSYSLKNSQSAQWLMAYLNVFCSSKNETDSKIRFYFKSIIEFLSQSLTVKFFKKKFDFDVEPLIHVINKYGAPFLSFEQVFKIWKIDNELVADYFKTQLFTNAENSETLQHISNFLAEYKLLEENTNSLLEEELNETIIYIDKVILSLNENNRSSGFSFKTLKKFIEYGLKNLNLSYKGEPLQGLQIMGLLETRCLSFENVIILGCNEGFLPKASQQNSYIPFDVRRVFNLPMPNQSDYNTAYYFYRLLQYPKNTFLIFDTDADGFGGGEKSRFISQIKQEFTKSNISESIAMIGEVTNSSSNEILISKDENIERDLTNYLENRGLTPTAINTYLNCSLKFYFKYIASLKELEETDEFLGADVLGKLAHRILEILYTPFIGKVITSTDILKLESQIDELTVKACKDIEITNRIEDGKNLLVINIAKKFVKNFMSSEHQLTISAEAKNEVLSIINLEQKLESYIDVNINGSVKRIKLSGFADRIDRVGDRIRIIDYKTGQIDERKLRVENIETLFESDDYDKALQLLHYAFLYSNNSQSATNIQSGIVSFRNFKKGVLSLGIGSSALLTDVHFDDYVTFLTKFISTIFDKETSFSQTKNHASCEFCEYVSLCKRN